MMPEQSPQQLLNYFERLVAEGNTSPQYSAGVTLSKRHIALLQMSSVSEDEFRSLLNDIETVAERPGSGIFDLWLQVRHWGYERGFSVPKDHPWRVDRRRWTCESTGEYVGQITVGEDYEILDIDEVRQLVRLVADNGRTRWYPAGLFVPPMIPQREWIRKG